MKLAWNFLHGFDHYGYLSSLNIFGHAGGRTRYPREGLHTHTKSFPKFATAFSLCYGYFRLKIVEYAQKVIIRYDRPCLNIFFHFCCCYVPPGELSYSAHKSRRSPMSRSPRLRQSNVSLDHLSGGISEGDSGGSAQSSQTQGSADSRSFCLASDSSRLEVRYCVDILTHI